MRSGRRRLARAAIALAAIALLSACANRPPVDLSAQFTPPSGHWLAPPPATPARPVCRVALSGLHDQRVDPNAMGDIGGRMVHAADAPGWVRSGLQSLSRDPRIAVVDGAADLTLDVDIVKAYSLSITMEKSITVVLRVRFAHGGSAPDEQVFRGVDTATNWVSGADETQIGFDDALRQIIEALDAQIVARCAA
ncbi:MAG TPA: hypothetical protein VHZ78_06135 [Rhizomicrobium sp.]|jgi:hypothetical protein|nr:hypothetical protein [Rhizomicrobium sp.]